MILENLGRPVYHKLEPMKLSALVYCGRRPYSPRQLVEKGIKRSLSLQRGWYEIFTDTPHETAQVSAADAYQGLAMFGVPLSDIWRPQRTELRTIFTMILSVNEPIYFHCLHGKDRTGYVRAIYRMVVQGWGLEAALAEMYNQGFHRFPYFWWTWRLLDDAEFIGQELTPLVVTHRVFAASLEGVS